MLPPLEPELVLVHPFLEQAVESLADVQEPLLEAPPRRALGEARSCSFWRWW
jgi:hypothetical protein